MRRPSVLASGLLVLPLLACSAATPAPAGDGAGSPDASVATGNDAGAQSTPSVDSGASDSGAPSSDASAPPADSGGDQAPPSGDAGDAGLDLDMQASDFDCILAWPKVGDYRVTNKLGNLSGSLAIANAPDGGVFPVGTVVQLIPNEAMVKRYAGFNASSDDWEFFNLSTSASGTIINQRGGGASVTNFTGSSCLNCHSGAEAQWNMICGTTHGCAPLPISESTIQSIQNGDPRCAGVDGG